MRCVAEDIRRNIMYTALSINTYKIKSFYTNISEIQTYQYLLIIDKLSMIQLALLITIDK